MDNTNSVQNEQFGEHAENTMNELENENSSNNEAISSEEIEMESQLIISDESLVPEELNDNDEDDNEFHVNESNADYSRFSNEELITKLEQLLNEKTIEKIRYDVENIKINFYKKHKIDIELKRKEHFDNGGTNENFVYSDPLEEKLKELIIKYKDKRRQHNQQSEDEKLANLRIKEGIIEEIKNLADTNETFQDAYNRFRDLQKQWSLVGMVPQKDVTSLYENYNHHVERFYDLIKISKELRELDFKKNLELKITLCEKAEQLILESDILKAFKELQEYHFQWREIGPVSNEKREEVWERFKAATTIINKSHQEYFESQKEEQRKNLELKNQLCEKAEEITNHQYNTLKEWEESSKQMIELQQLWRTIGFAPRKENNKIYQRFHEICNNYFVRKKDYYSVIKDEQNKNYQQKLDICIQAEALQKSEEWKKSTDELIRLQKQWKDIGPVPRKFSDTVWKRFRAACDEFFKRKSDHFSNIDNTYEENLNKKLALLEEVKAYQINENLEQSFAELQQFQHRWSEIGYVPLKKKEEIQKAFRDAIDIQFNKMKVDDGKRRMLKFKNKIEGISTGTKSKSKINFERDKYITQLRKLENDIKLWENNIGFFARSKNAEALTRDVQSKIDQAKEEIKMLIEKINLIDNMSHE